MSFLRRIYLEGIRLAAGVRNRRAVPLPDIGGIKRLTFLKLDGIGDLVLATTTLRAVEEKFPNLQTTLIVRVPNGALAKQQFPNWEIIELPARDKPSVNLFRHGSRRQLKRLAQADLLVDLRAYRDYSDSILASWIPARCKVGLENAYPATLSTALIPRETHIFDQLIPRPEPTSDAHDLMNHRALLKAVFGIQAEGKTPSLKLPIADTASVTAKLRERLGAPVGKYAVICPGTSSVTKESPTATLATALREGLAGWDGPILIAGGSGDDRSTKPLLDTIRDDPRVHDVTRLFSLPEHVALLGGASLIVTMDSCHVHIAGAFGIPCVCIFGGGQFGEFGPWGESARFRWVYRRIACYGCQWICPFPQPNCLHDIPPTAIAQAIREVLAASA